MTARGIWTRLSRGNPRWIYHLGLAAQTRGRLPWFKGGMFRVWGFHEGLNEELELASVYGCFTGFYKGLLQRLLEGFYEFWVLEW